MMSGLRRAIARQSPLQREVARHIDVPGLPRRRTVQASVWAVTMVKNEADVIGHTVRHLLSQGVDGVVVADNLSTDDTPDVLAALAREDDRVHVGTDTLVAYHQGRKMSHLANLARRAGADWVVLFDADEFWFAEGVSVADHLRTSRANVKVVEAAVFDAHAVRLGGITWSDPGESIRLDARPHSKKVAIRPRRWVWVATGNHHALDLAAAQDFGLRIVHLPHRSFEQLEQKVTQGAVALRSHSAIPSHTGYHWRSAADQSSQERRTAWEREIEDSDGEVVAAPTRWRTWKDRGGLA